MTPARSTSRREGSSARELRSVIRIESTPSSAAVPQCTRSDEIVEELVRHAATGAIFY
jgi:hypothetical protein